MYQLQQWAAVQELHRKGTSIRGIAKQLAISRNTVRKLLTEKPANKKSRGDLKKFRDGFWSQVFGPSA